jgi:hypothetical protein
VQSIDVASLAALMTDKNSHVSVYDVDPVSDREKDGSDPRGTWYAIEKLNPLLNVERRAWNQDSQGKYEGLLRKLVASRDFTCDDLKMQPTGPGIYILYHDRRPE